ncbi:diacylglycerol kinase family lipid kinase [Bengtsoniella intestinalis]|uniref:diacylglycerol/lipid kinase family protein n=1 Tax=Bengtsoniella intestinalis TaxID=3073143 RepID=UPI00391FC19B
MDKRLLFILNPTAGVNRTFAPLLEALDLLSQAGYALTVRTTTQVGDATNFVLQYGQKVETIVCCGGDGTLNETISGIMQLEHKPCLGYLPRGSTNDFATSMGISQNPVIATEAMLASMPRAVDVGLLNGRSFVYVACFGAFTKSAYSAPQAMKNVLGHFAYVLEGIKDISSLRPYKIKVTADDEILDGEYLFGAVCNSTSIGGLMRLDHLMVTLDDGRFELLLIPSPQTAIDLQNIVRALLTQNYNSQGLVFRHVSAVHVETQEALPWALDGEYAPSAATTHIVNHQQAVRILK